MTIKKTSVWILILIPLATIVQCTREQGEEFEPATQVELETQLTSASKAWSTAFYEGDGETMDSLELSDLVLVFGTGHIWHKSEPRLNSIQPIESVKSNSKEFIKVHLFENVGVLIGHLMVEESDNKSTFGFTEVWVKQDGQWHVVTAQWSEPQEID